ncbi:MAG: flagellar hook-length control protein FliK [Clostridiales bacterium]|nr:flagellar hook-length control protein FliK [Clostridiales bacterium]
MTVSNVNVAQGYAVGQAASSGMGQEELVTEGFQRLMTKMSDQLSGLQSDTAESRTLPQSSASQTTSKKDAAQEEGGKEITPSKDSAQTEQTRDAAQQSGNKEVSENDGKMEKVQEQAEKTGEELVQDIAQELDVTAEEVEAAMEILGLTAAQLLDPDNLKQLLLNLTDSTDELSLVTDESLYGSLQDLLETLDTDLDTLAEELDVSREELNVLLEQAVSGQPEAGIQEPDMQEMTPMQERPEPALEGMKDYTVSVQRDGETVQMKVTVDDASGSKSVTEEVTAVPGAEETRFSGRKESGASDLGNREEGNAAGNLFTQTPVQQTEVNVVQAEEPVFQSADTQEIMDQIMEYMKINLTADTQELEMQLHPASLGTVNVQIAAKDGVMTAHFTTQDETVRTVIETQLIQLKNQFEEQGIKVDAVEVTVAEHAYGEQPGEQREEMEQKQAGAGKGVRRINLDEIDEETDLAMMEDSERIAVEMMQANGSTVDYTA